MFPDTAHLRVLLGLAGGTISVLLGLLIRVIR